MNTLLKRLFRRNRVPTLQEMLESGNLKHEKGAIKIQPPLTLEAVDSTCYFKKGQRVQVDLLDLNGGPPFGVHVVGCQWFGVNYFRWIRS